jgi:hypothetical protein
MPAEGSEPVEDRVVTILPCSREQVVGAKERDEATKARKTHTKLGVSIARKYLKREQML